MFGGVCMQLRVEAYRVQGAGAHCICCVQGGRGTLHLLRSGGHGHTAFAAFRGKVSQTELKRQFGGDHPVSTEIPALATMHSTCSPAWPALSLACPQPGLPSACPHPAVLLPWWSKEPAGSGPSKEAEAPTGEPGNVQDTDTTQVPGKSRILGQAHATRVGPRAVGSGGRCAGLCGVMQGGVWCDLWV